MSKKRRLGVMRDSRFGSRSLVTGCWMLAACIFLSGCGGREKIKKDLWYPMGTFATVTVPASEDALLPQYTDVAKTIFQDFDNSLSIYKSNSELSLINRSAGKHFVPVSEHTRCLLELSLQYSEVGHGSFDITVAPLVRLWGFSGGTKPKARPGKEEIRSALDLTGYAHLVVSNNMVRLDKPGMMIDLGGIAKGYAVDVCYRRLLKGKAENVMINLGGNIRCLGTAAKEKPWKIGVRDPFDETQLLGTINLSDGMAVATSGNYERYEMIDGERYAHIIDPRTGYPVKGMAGVTVVSTTAVEADVMSTAFFVLGVEASRGVAASLPGSHVLMVPDEQPIRVIVDAWMKENFVPIKGLKVEDL